MHACDGDLCDADNMEQFVGLQVEAVDGLATQMELLRNKMTLYKEQHATEKCSAFRDAVVTSRCVGGGVARLYAVVHDICWVLFVMSDYVVCCGIKWSF
jgi:hypothetical protein